MMEVNRRNLTEIPPMDIDQRFPCFEDHRIWHSERSPKALLSAVEGATQGRYAGRVWLVGGERGRREWIADGLVWAVLTAPVAAKYVMRADWRWGPVAIAATAVAVLSARRVPLFGWLVVVLGTLFDGNFAFAIPVLSYLVGLRTERVRPVVAGFLVIAAGGTVLNLGVLRTGPAQWFLLAITLLAIGLFPWLVGRYQAQRARLVSAGWERAARLEYERRMVVRQAELRERARIAQEMHDCLGHELSLIALGAGALETNPGVDEGQRATAARIRESAATATDQLREIIGVLRDEDDQVPLEPAGERVEALVERAQESGMAVTVRRTGDAAELPAAVERTAYRVVREALTNASRHAPGAATTVEVVHRAETTTVSVENEAPKLKAERVTSGLGLIGLRERVRLVGGTLIAGPTSGDGFRAQAELPHRPSPVPGVEMPAATELRSARRRVNRSLATALLTPAVLASVAAIGYYSFAVAGSVLDEQAFDRMTIGTPRADLAGVLPSRQVWQRPQDGGASCEFYTDGNFPMADASYRLCFAGGRLISKDRLR
jgi:signal transduction histidine kinase